MVKIGDVTVNSKLALAPMAGVTDLAFRTICRELGAGLTYTEMVSSKALVFQDKKTLRLLELGDGETPAAVQIFGSEPETMAQAAVRALEISGADFIDINMGCPVGKIVKSGDGCALMRDPTTAEAIIRAVKREVNTPVTVKFRKGWDKGNVNAVEFAKMAESAGADAITVHGRTRVQMYSGRADWDIIKQVKQAVKIPVIANGDVFTPNDALRILKYTGADIAMIGRGAMGNPWIFEQSEALLKQEVPNGREVALVKERAETALRQLKLAAAQKGEHIACLEARKYFSWYLRGVPHSGHLKKKISAASVVAEFESIAEQMKRSI